MLTSLSKIDVYFNLWVMFHFLLIIDFIFFKCFFSGLYTTYTFINVYSLFCSFFIFFVVNIFTRVVKSYHPLYILYFLSDQCYHPHVLLAWPFGLYSEKC